MVPFHCFNHCFRVRRELQMWRVSDQQTLCPHRRPLHGKTAKWTQTVSSVKRKMLLFKITTVKMCLYFRNSVLLGEMDASKDVDCETQQNFEVCNPPTQSFGIEQAIPHPQYSPSTVQNDIGIIRLNRDADFSVGNSGKFLYCVK